MSLHIRTFTINANEATLFVTLSFGLVVVAEDSSKDYFGVMARITRKKNRDKTEKLLGYAGINRNCELVNYPTEEISDSELEAIEREIRGAVQ